MKALMLDVDGVLISSASHWTKNLQKELGISPDKLRKFFFEKHWHKVIIGTIGIEPMLELALKQMKSETAVETLLDFWLEADASIDHRVLSDLTALRRTGLKVYLTTNQEHRRAQYLMEQLDLKAHVDGIRYSAALGARQPDKAFFKKAAIPEVATNGHLLVDDTPNNVSAARKAGWSAHHWEAGQSLMKVAQDAYSIS